MVFGTFDIIHKGHLNFFWQARKLAPRPFLIVSVARDVNVKQIKGRLPTNLEKLRLGNIKKLKAVDKAVLGGVKDYIAHILRQKPAVIALGYDQSAYTRGLKTKLMEKGLRPTVVRLKPYKPHVYKSSFFKRMGL